MTVEVQGYVVQVWCPDCLHEDYQGCFDGGYDFLTAPGSLSTQVYPTREEAETAGAEYVAHTIYQYEVLSYAQVEFVESSYAGVLNVREARRK